MWPIKSILYIDDDRDDQLVLTAAVSEVDPTISIQCDSDGYNALKHLKATSEKPDLIILDINMPKVNGFQLCEMIKMDESLESIPVLFYSTTSARTEIEKAKKAGGWAFIIKSYSYNQLEGMISYILGKTEDPPANVHTFRQLFSSL